MPLGEMINAREAMQAAIECAQRGDAELGKLWLGIARELRIGSTPAPKPPVEPYVPQADWDRAASRTGRGSVAVVGDIGPETLVRVPTPRPFERPLSTAGPQLDKPAVEPLLDYGQRYEDDPTIARAEHVMQSELDHEQAATAAFGDPETLRMIADKLRVREDEPTAGEVESDEQRLRRTPRPFIDDGRRFDAFAAGRARAATPPQQLEETTLLSAGDPSRCRHCDFEIYEAEPSEISTRYRWRHTSTRQAVCPTPPRHTSEQGDETYVTGPRTMAEPGGVAYRAS